MHDEQLAYIEKLNHQEELSREDVQALINEVKRLRYAAPRESAIMRAHMERFFTRWGPNKTVQLRVEFQTDFHELVQRIYIAAQEPFLKAAADAFARQPVPQFFAAKPEK